MDKELRILILEDVPSDAELEEHALRKAGLVFTSKIVDTREAFLKALEEFLPDLILSDYDLPSFDGLAALRIAKEKCPDVPFILVSGKVGEEFAIEKLKEGATDYVLKNNLKRLVPVVNRALEEAKLITTRKKIQDEIINTKERLCFILNTALMALHTSKASGGYGATFISGSIEGLLGYKPEDFTTNSSFWSDNIHPDDRERVFQELPNIFKYGYHVHDYRFRHADGTYHWIHDELKLIYDKNGNPFEIVGCWMDITERKQTEDLLREDEKQLASIFRASPSGIGVVSSPDRLLLKVNERLCKMLGYSEKELIGKSARVLYPTDEDFEYVGKRKYELIKEHGVGTVETRFKCKDGKIIDVLLSSSPIDKNDISLDITFTVLDITERKRAEDALQDSEERFRNLMEYVPESIQGYTLDGTIFYWNKASEKIYGYAAEEAIGKNLGDLIVPSDLKPLFRQCLEIAKKIKQSGEFMPSGELMLLHKEGHLIPIYSIHTAVYIEGKEPLLYCIDIDLSEQKQTEETLRKNENDLIKRIEELEDFYNMAISRELRMIELKKENNELKEKFTK